MDAALNRKSLAFGIPGIILPFVGQFMVRSQGASNGMVVAGAFALLTGCVLLCMGLAMHAKSKGHSPWWGLMGLFSIVLPDRTK